jgi:ankyrin repeat protein
MAFISHFSSSTITDSGALEDFKVGYYGTALQAVSHCRDVKTDRLLYAAMARTNNTHEEFYNRYETTVKILLDAGADVNTQGGYYGTALQAASSNGEEMVVKILLDAGADVNTQGGYYGTALQPALYEGKEEIVKMLLDAGADVNTQGGHYGTALQAASSNSRSRS